MNDDIVWYINNYKKSLNYMLRSAIILENYIPVVQRLCKPMKFKSHKPKKIFFRDPGSWLGLLDPTSMIDYRVGIVVQETDEFYIFETNFLWRFFKKYWIITKNSIYISIIY